MILDVQIQPNAKRSELVSWDGALLKLRIAAPPIEGKANVALLKFLGKTFNVPPSSITLLRGSTGKHKRLEIPGDASLYLPLLTSLAPDPSPPHAKDGISSDASS